MILPSPLVNGELGVTGMISFAGLQLLEIDDWQS